MAVTPITLPVAEWAPDLPAFQGNPASGQPMASMTVKNVVPRTPQSYGPLSSLVQFSGPLGSRAQGAAALLDTAGNVTVYAGDATNLYKLDQSSTSWTQISKSAGAYTIAADGRWDFVLFGSRVIATDFGDNIQSYVQGTSTTFTDLASAAPRARYATVIKSFLMVGNTYDTTSGDAPQRVWWAANNDPTNWPTPGTATAAEFQSDYLDLVGDAGWVQGIVGNLGNADGAVFQEHAVWRVMYDGPPTTFGFYPAEGVRGTPAPWSIVQMGNYVYYLGEDGFYRFDGSQSDPIGANRVDKTFWADVDQSSLYRIVGVADPINKLIIWAYPGSGSAAGNPNKLLIYNWQIDRWSLAEVTVEDLVRVLSFGYTLDQLYTVLGYTIDALPFNLDSRAWTGGKLLLGAFDTSHQLNYFSGAPLAATVDTAEMQPFPGRRAKVRNTRPLVDGGTPSVAIAARNRLIDSTTLGTAVAINSIGTCPLRADGRYLRGEVTTNAGDTWTHIQGLELEVIPSGQR